MEYLYNDAVAFGLIMIVLMVIFHTSSSKHPAWVKFYRYVPALLLCYFVPAFLHEPLGLLAPHWFDEGLASYIAQFNLKMPSGLSYGDLNDWLDQSGLFQYGYEHFQVMGEEFNVNALKKYLLSSHALELPADMSFVETKEWLSSVGMPAVGYSHFEHHSNLYYVSSRYLLPASLVLLCLSIDIKGIINLGYRAIIMFFAATLGIILGGPIALLVVGQFFPDLINSDMDQVWRGLSTVAGSWIGGGANQTAMKEIFEVGDRIFASMVVVDVIVANIWMGFLLYGANISDKIDKKLKADNSSITELKEKISNYRASILKVPTTTDYFKLAGVAFGSVALAHFGADHIINFLGNYSDTLKSFKLNSLLSRFFWLIVIVTTIGLVLSFTRYRKLEGVGASKIGSVFLYILVATIGMKMNILEIFDNLGLFAVGIIWMMVHVSILLITAKLIKAPFFYVAVGSQANVGGAASAPIVAAAFSPSLAPVGVLMAVLGYALGTYGAIICALMMESAAGMF